MSEGQLVASGDESEYGAEIIDKLPTYMARHPGSGNFKLLDVVGQLFDRTEADIKELDNATSVQEADSVEQLENLSQLVNLNPKDGTTLGKYRDRSIAEFQMMTSEGTAEDILGAASTILNIDIKRIDYRKLDENGAVNLMLPSSALDSSELADEEIAEIISKQAAAGFRIQATRRGTFTYLPESAYSGPYDDANGGYDETQLDSDPEKGYDGLDADGNPKDNGGTYAGLI